MRVEREKITDPWDSKEKPKLESTHARVRKPKSQGRKSKAKTAKPCNKTLNP